MQIVLSQFAPVVLLSKEKRREWGVGDGHEKAKSRSWACSIKYKPCTPCFVIKTVTLSATVLSASCWPPRTC